MPYITQRERDLLAEGDGISTAGQLNYTITKLITTYLHSKGLKYQTINDIVGALDSVKVEFQRRVVAPYEDQKIQENGDL